MRLLDGKVALVTGASQGVGFAIALGLAVLPGAVALVPRSCPHHPNPNPAP